VRCTRASRRRDEFSASTWPAVKLIFVAARDHDVVGAGDNHIRLDFVVIPPSPPPSSSPSVVIARVAVTAVVAPWPVRHSNRVPRGGVPECDSVIQRAPTFTRAGCRREPDRIKAATVREGVGNASGSVERWCVMLTHGAIC